MTVEEITKILDENIRYMSREDVIEAAEQICEMHKSRGEDCDGCDLVLAAARARQ